MPELKVEREKKSFNGRMVDGKLIMTFYIEYYNEDGSYNKSSSYEKVFDDKEEMNGYIDTFFEEN